jgi:glyoxylase-like metal-dependent hydrolase (beta-lactamase superfamily II)
MNATMEEVMASDRWRCLIAVFAFGAGLPAGAQAQRPGGPLIDDVAQAIGGRDRILAIRTLVLEGKGENYNLGQNPLPDAPLRVFAVTAYTQSIDFANRRWRLDQTREPRFVMGFTAPARQRIGFDSVSIDILSDTLTRRGSPRADIDRADEFMYHPIGFLQTALKAGTELTEGPARGGLRYVRMNAAGSKFGVLIDPKTKLPVTIEKIVYHPMLGDVLLETRFSDWMTIDGMKLPMRISQRLDSRWPLSDIKLSASKVNADVGDIAASPALRSAPAFVTPVNVTVDSVAPGVWFLAGQSHHSVVIEMRDHLLLVEAPQGDDRTLAVIRKARELRPGKPLRAVINTHHHFDHAGGIRAAISEGLTVITHSANAPFFQNLAKRQHFIVRDALARSPKPARIEGVTTKRVLTSGARKVEIHHIRGSQHAGSLLMVYLPAEKLLIEADVYSPPAANATTIPPAPFAANLVENIDRLGLDVERIVPIHGRVVPMSDLRAAAKVAAAPTAQ